MLYYSKKDLQRYLHKKTHSERQSWAEDAEFPSPIETCFGKIAMENQLLLYPHHCTNPHSHHSHHMSSETLHTAVWRGCQQGPFSTDHRGHRDQTGSMARALPVAAVSPAGAGSLLLWSCFPGHYAAYATYRGELDSRLWVEIGRNKELSKDGRAKFQKLTSMSRKHLHTAKAYEIAKNTFGFWIEWKPCRTTLNSADEFFRAQME